MNTDKINLPATLVNLFQKAIHPIEIPSNCGTADFDTFLSVREDLLHEKLSSGGRLHVGLAADVGLVEAQKVLGQFLVDLSFTLFPELVILGSPIHRNVFNR